MRNTIINPETGKEIAVSLSNYNKFIESGYIPIKVGVENSYLNDLPEGPLIEIMLSTGFPNFKDFCYVNKKLAKLCNDEQLWYILYEREFGPVLGKRSTSYYDLYVSRLNQELTNIRTWLKERYLPSLSSNKELYETDFLYLAGTFSYGELPSFPISFKYLINIHKLEIYSNKLVEFPSFIHYLVNLEVLNISKNRLTSVPDSIEDLEHLKELIMNDNQIRILPESIGHLSELTYLNVAGNPLVALPNSIVDLENLATLDIGETKITEDEYVKLENIMPWVQIWY